MYLKTTTPGVAALDPSLINRYDVRGPRYTSYPTAAQFKDDFGEAHLRAAMIDSNSPPVPAPLSLYVHIPFCEQLCFYCACNKIITQDRAKAEDYLQLLIRESALHAALLDNDREVRQLHLGGGSPTFFSDEQLDRLIDGLSQHFRMSGDQPEWSIEIDPRTVTASRMRYLAQIGFNRVSFGIQDVNEAVQVAVNRIQSLQQIKDCIAAARQAGMRSVSVDLIYGLPLQTVDSFSETLEIVRRMGPDRIAIYNYAHLPQRFKAQRLIPERYLPPAADKLAIQALISDRLNAAGYVHIGMDHYALPEDELMTALDNGSLQRNFQGYSTHGGCELIGLGVSAISAIGNCYAQNELRMSAYRERLNAGSIPTIRGLGLSEDDQIRAGVISQIMCRMRIDKSAFRHRFGVEFDDYFAVEARQLERMQNDGLLTADDSGYRVTPVGRYFLRNIAMCFDRYNQPEQGFSKTL
ncbi:MAG: oxygen-independent coproporphyrinogen III oxidase [Wenzhouxiangellaceae bacterium]